MRHRDSAKLLKKSSLINSYDEVLFKEPIGIRQLVGLTRWNKLLSDETISNEVLRDSQLPSKFRMAVSDSE